jgi:hypothetical protein
VNSSKQIAARGDPSRLLRAWKSCIFVTRNNNSWTGGRFVDCTDVTYASCGKHVRICYWLYQYKLLYNGTLLLQFLPLVNYTQLIIRPFSISSDGVIYIYIYLYKFKIFTFLTILTKYFFCVYVFWNHIIYFSTYIQKLMFLLQDQH